MPSSPASPSNPSTTANSPLIADSISNSPKVLYLFIKATKELTTLTHSESSPCNNSTKCISISRFPNTHKNSTIHILSSSLTKLYNNQRFFTTRKSTSTTTLMNTRHNKKIYGHKYSKPPPIIHKRSSSCKESSSKPPDFSFRILSTPLKSASNLILSTFL